MRASERDAFQADTVTTASESMACESGASGRGPLVRSGRNTAWGALAVLAYAALIAARIPAILLQGRFWGEESAVYFAAARTGPALDALFLVHTGYLNLAASAATLLAAAAPLDDAPWVSTTVALLIQLLPPVLLLTGRVSWLRRPWQAAAALVLLLTVPNSGELWMNSITSQFHLALGVGLILALDTRAGAVGVLRGAVLVLAPLSGPASAFFAPLFLLRAGLDRSPARLAQAALLGGAVAVQLAMVLGHPEPARPIGIAPSLLALVVYVKHVLMPVLGPGETDALSRPLMDEAAAGRIPPGPLLCVVLVAAVLAWGAWASRDAVLRWLLAGGATVMALSYFGALGSHLLLVNASFGGRYAFVPASLLALAVFGLSQSRAPRARSGPLRWPASFVALWIGIVGIVAYPRVPPYFTHGSSWRAEVARLRADPAYRPQVWPDDPIWKFPIGPAD